jgi:PKD repeat protein
MNRQWIVCLSLCASVLLASACLAAEAPNTLSAADVEVMATGASPRVLTGEIVEIDPSELTCDAVVTFDDLVGGPEPGTNYDGIFESGGADFAERFVGQTLTYSGDFDILSGTPTAPLALQVGLPTQNLVVEYYAPVTSQVMAGLGPRSWPNFDAIGEGSFAILFDYDQSEFGFELMGGNNGSCTVDFFRRDGTLIDSHTITNITEDSYAFRRAGGIHDIAGISLQNTDPAGIGVDNLCHDVGGVPGYPPVCVATATPNPACIGADVAFDGSGSYDPDGSVVSYEWAFGDGGTASGAAAMHAYASAGSFVATLCVTDDEDNETCCEMTIVVETCVIPVPVDIKPTSCPNPLNTKSNGVLPVAILGTEDFDVMSIDPATIRLEGVAPLRWAYEDVATPVDLVDRCDCTTLGPDGYVDLTLKFDTEAIVAALGTVYDGEIRSLDLTGATFDPTPIEGADCVRIIYKEAPAGPKTPVATWSGTGQSVLLNLEERARVSVAVYDVMGHKVKTLVDGSYERGVHSFEWDGTDDRGASVAGGIYFCRASANGVEATAKMVLAR